jgi:3-hydroxyisobutyrate dehydrogenase-like beta-hydroxyacid dehydrogenase
LRFGQALLDKFCALAYDPLTVIICRHPMSDPKSKVGFIGIGRMGEPMARNVLAAGIDLTVYDVRAEQAAKLVSLGAQGARSPRELAAWAEIVALVVVDDAQVETVLIGADGVFAGARPGTIVAIHSTVLPETVRRLAALGAQSGIHVIDAPVSGGESGARQKNLSYMVGGPAELLERCREVFTTSAAQVFHMGELGSGAAAKMIVQVVTCINMLAAHEAEAVAARCGLDFKLVQEVLKHSSGQSFVAENWLDRFKLAGDPLATRRRRTEVFQKSLGPALQLARQLELNLAGTELAERAMARIMGIED